MSIDFKIIEGSGPVSSAFLNLGKRTFEEAGAYVRDVIPYQRAVGKKLLSVLEEGRGTCRHKNGIIAELAREHGYGDVLKLVFEVYEQENDLYLENSLPHVPSVTTAIHHIKNDGGFVESLSFTRPNQGPRPYIHSFQVTPRQALLNKERYNRAYIERWRGTHTHTDLTTAEIWELREEVMRRKISKQVSQQLIPS